MIGIISGSNLLKEFDIFRDRQEITVINEFGRTELLVTDSVAFLPRHGYDPGNYILPHLINHKANMKALQELGIWEVIGINSTGSLKIELEPGKIVIPDDFIMLASYPSLLANRPVHITPALNAKMRGRLLEAARKAGIEVRDCGTYWQTTGPRLETRAEIRLMSQFADLVGMTMATEAITAQEMGLSYASACSVDNYAHGLEGEKTITIEEISERARLGGETLSRLIIGYLQDL